MTADDKPDEFKFFVDAQGIFRQMRDPGSLRSSASLSEVASKLNALANEAEDAGVFPREHLPRLPTNATVDEVKTAGEAIVRAFHARFPDIFSK